MSRLHYICHSLKGNDAFLTNFQFIFDKKYEPTLRTSSNLDKNYKRTKTLLKLRQQLKTYSEISLIEVSCSSIEVS